MHDPRTTIFRKVRQLTSLLHGTLPAYQRMRFQLAAEAALAELSEAQRTTVATVWDGTARGFEDVLATVAPNVHSGLVFRYNPDELTFEDEDEDEDGDDD